VAVAGALRVEDPKATLRLLARRALVEEAPNPSMPEQASDRVRVRLHPLLHALAQDEFTRTIPQAEQHQVYRAIVAHFADYPSALTKSPAALGPDEPNIYAALEWAHKHEETALELELCRHLADFWYRHWRTRASLKYLPWGMALLEANADALRTTADRRDLGHLYLMFGYALDRAGMDAEAESSFQRALTLAQAAHHQQGEGDALSALGERA